MAHHHHHHHQSEKNIGLAFALNLLFVIIEIIGGIFTGSIAILADAVHDLGDSLSLGLAWGLQKLSHKKRDENFSYGYGRFSLLSALISGSVILVGSIWVFSESLPRFWNTTTPPHGPGMFALALLGCAINAFAAFRLSKGHSHNEQMLKWHLLEDSFGWGAVLVGSIVIMQTSWTWVDPLLACGLSLFVSWNVIKQLFKTARLFLQATPEDFDENGFFEKVLGFPEVQTIHDFHVWSLDGHRHILSLHVVLNKEIQTFDVQLLKNKIRQCVESPGHYHFTIEVEDPKNNCPEDSPH
jgi:cobalt-zinc-cadmium efflux system protein